MDIIGERIKEIRKLAKLTQKEFGQRISVAQTYLSQIEKGERDATEKIIKLISHEFNIDEDWLRTGEGEMFNESDEFSLDEYAKQHSMSEIDLKIIKGFLDLDPEVRKIVVSTFKNALSDDRSEVKEKAEKVVDTISRNETKENVNPYRIKETILNVAEAGTEYLSKSDIDVEVESYRNELETERQNKISSALPDSSENLG